MKTKLQQVAKIFSIIVLVLVLGAVGLLSFFLHKNFYQTINHSKTILLLRSEIALFTPDMTTYQKLVKYIEEKEVKEIEWEKVKNPFVGYE